MKRTVLAIASLLAFSAGAVQAQTVTLFGLVDTGVERLSNAGVTEDELYRMPTLAGSFASRWGMRGSEDLGGGLKAIFTLESGFATDSGIFQQGGRLFGRQLFVGLSGGWGTVSLGRHYSMLLFASLNTDIMIAQIYGSGAFDLFLAAPRVDNSILYTGKFGGVTVGGTYSLGRDGLSCPGERGDSNECTQWSAMLKYDQPNWGVGAWIDEQRGLNATLNAPPGATNTSAETDRRAAVLGYFLLGKTKFSANYLDRNNETVAAALQDSTLWSVAVSHPLASVPIVLEAQYYDFDQEDNDNDGSMLVLRGTYSFSKRTATYVTIGHLTNDGAARFSPSVGTSFDTSATSVRPNAGVNQTGVMLGLRHSF